MNLKDIVITETSSTTYSFENLNTGETLRVIEFEDVDNEIVDYNLVIDNEDGRTAYNIGSREDLSSFVDLFDYILNGEPVDTEDD